MIYIVKYDKEAARDKQFVNHFDGDSADEISVPF
jgi:hypothetical protein